MPAKIYPVGGGVPFLVGGKETVCIFEPVIPGISGSHRIDIAQSVTVKGLPGNGGFELLLEGGPARQFLIDPLSVTEKRSALLPNGTVVEPITEEELAREIALHEKLLA